MGGMDPGVAVAGLALLQTERNKGYDAEWDSRRAERQHSEYIFKAKSHVHGMRAGIHAHRITEDKLIAALKAENANHPLASRAAVDEAVRDEYAKALINPDVIKKTYPDGKLPDGAVMPPDLTHQIA